MEKKICMICKTVIPGADFVEHFRICREQLTNRSSGRITKKARIKSGGCGCGAKKKGR